MGFRRDDLTTHVDDALGSTHASSDSASRTRRGSSGRSFAATPRHQGPVPAGLAGPDGHSPDVDGTDGEDDEEEVAHARCDQQDSAL